MIESVKTLERKAKLLLDNIFLVDPERRKLKDFLEAPSEVRDQKRDEIGTTLREIEGKIQRRERDPARARKEIDLYGEQVAVIEQRLIEPIEHERRNQHRIALGSFALLGLLTVGTFGIGFYRVLAPTASLVQGGIFFLLVVVLFYIMRVSQNAREAAERMDEKSVAIKFMRYALGAMVERPDMSPMVEAGIAMFLAHHSPSSEPLSRDDSKVLERLLQAVKGETSTAN